MTVLKGDWFQAKIFWPVSVNYGKVFMQEFFESRRKYQQAPQVLFSHKHPPAE